MRRLLLVAVLMVAALPAQAFDCQELTIEHKHGTELVSGYEEYHGFHTSVVGYFLWVDFGESEYSSDSNTISSIDVSDPNIVGALVCADDQTVELITKSEPAPDPIKVSVEEPAVFTPAWSGMARELL